MRDDKQRIYYVYDPLGRRIAKSSDKGVTNFLWMDDVLMYEGTRKNNVRVSERLYLFEPGTFKPLAFVENREVYHYHLDHLGTPQEITDKNGDIVWAVSFKAYGNLAVAYENQIENNLRFQGQYFDEETGLHYNRFRYYDPGCGRFINQDPIGLAGGNNNYLYVPNPTGWVDPFGLSSKEYKTGDPNKEQLALPAPKDSNPWMSNSKIESNVVGDDGLVVYRAHGEGRATGGWVTLEPPPNQGYVRQNLAVAPEWNDASHVSKIKLSPGTRYQSGVAGPQNFPGGVGGGDQIQVLNFKNLSRHPYQGKRANSGRAYVSR